MIILNVIALILVVVAITALVLARLTKNKRQLSKWYKQIATKIRKVGRTSNTMRGQTSLLLEHVKHHADEGIIEGVDIRWMASMENLMEIIRRVHLMSRPSDNIKLERLFLHWVKDPKNMDPPPDDFLHAANQAKSDTTEDKEQFSGS